MIIKQNKPVRIGYVGDGDASGFNVEQTCKMGNKETGTKKRVGLREVLFERDGGEDAWYFVDNLWERLAITDKDLKGFSGFH